MVQTFLTKYSFLFMFQLHVFSPSGIFTSAEISQSTQVCDLYPYYRVLPAKYAGGYNKQMLMFYEEEYAVNIFLGLKAVHVTFLWEMQIVTMIVFVLNKSRSQFSYAQVDHTLIWYTRIWMNKAILIPKLAPYRSKCVKTRVSKRS